jgi:hypothetical protein
VLAFVEEHGELRQDRVHQSGASRLGRVRIRKFARLTER